MGQKKKGRNDNRLVARFRRTSNRPMAPLSAGERSFLLVSHKSDSSFAEKLVTLVHALAPPARLAFVNFPQQCRLDAAQACKGSALAELCNRYPKPIRIFFCTCSLSSVRYSEAGHRFPNLTRWPLLGIETRTCNESRSFEKRQRSNESEIGESRLRYRLSATRTIDAGSSEKRRGRQIEAEMKT